jgi:tRNA(adenine34) deaminase
VTISHHETYMRLALEQARLAEAAGEVPVGAVLVDQGEILAATHNSPVARHDPTAHAEILALRAAGLRRRNYRLPGATLYVTLEPCIMCAGAIVHARIGTLVFGARDLRFGGVRSKFALADSDLLNHQVTVVEGVLGDVCTAMLQSFFAAKRGAG